MMCTLDTKFERCRPRKAFEDYAPLLMPVLAESVLGLGSEVVHFLLRSMAPPEYRQCRDLFRALPATVKMAISEPTFVTLAVVGINLSTQRHVDTNDVQSSFASLGPKGDYTGENLCFPQLCLQLHYQPGKAAISRGAELEHFIADWVGCRVSLLYTNYQPVRNYAWRLLVRLPPKLTDDWHPAREAGKAEGRPRALVPSSNTVSGVYSPCRADPVSPGPEEPWEVDINGGDKPRRK
ncbi:hypothetical protein GGR56DRAFT_684135 [Xylariaceae sp. FL0804]|nr:hypothetical protein GGR56DRAFT_684135 [Xylariaceae sp. FL0804]